MNTYLKTLLFFFILIIIGISLFLVSNRSDTDKDTDIENDDPQEQLTVVEEELAKLPLEFSVRDRTVELNTDSIEPLPQEEFAKFPYEININNETRIIESNTEPKIGESPIEFIKQFITNEMPSFEELDATDETMYKYTASFYSMKTDDLEKYPIEDRAGAPSAEKGIVAYVQGMKFPDDSVGGEEHRLDFIVLANGSWHLIWHGERIMCRRLGDEYWQPADQPCP